ncbi:MAG: hypoxanthine-guanine phosphoribosyltransferase [Zoogloeaceae bacterium]|jgi:hypoxanthine phosphoribosyltransferase|nr:hypoxanthine-guanine phosphoribosyltransferase [Zoogloeaceae bacterium]
MNTDEALAILREAELIHSAEAVRAAVARVADEIRAELAGCYPVVLSVMSGAVPFAGHLLPLLDFPLVFDYLHVSRYGDGTSGSQLTWHVSPRVSLRDRHVLVIDDILDEGVTLGIVCEHLRQKGARRVHTAVFADKEIGRAKPLKADFVGLAVPNRFVFGFGMDIRGAWRNLPAIYAQKEDSPT